MISCNWLVAHSNHLQMTGKLDIQNHLENVHQMVLFDQEMQGFEICSIVWNASQSEEQHYLHSMFILSCSNLNMCSTNTVP
jgi:hypothetical protein